MEDNVVKSEESTVNNMKTEQIESEIWLGEYEVVPSLMLPCAFIKLENIDELLEKPQLPKDNKEIQYECEKCGKKFSEKLSLRKHMKRHSKKFTAAEEGFPCKICGYSTNKFTSIHTSWTSEKIFRCDECSSKFGRKSVLNRHKRNHNRNSTAKKTKSKTSSVTPAKSIKPETSDVESSNNYVDYFGEFSDHLSLNTERNTNSGEPIAVEMPPNELQEAKNQPKPQKIVDQLESMSYRKCLRKKEKTLPPVEVQLGQTHNQRQNTDIEASEAKIPVEPSVKKHNRRPQIVEKPLYCGECGKFCGTFEFPNIIKTHQQKHERDNKRFTCDICLRMKSRLKTHLAVENPILKPIVDMPESSNVPLVRRTEDNQPICHICGQLMSDSKPYRLTRHLETHAPRVQCEYCGKSLTPRSLHDHINANRCKRNIGERLICSICGKSFLSRRTRTAHFKLHSNKIMEQ